MEVAGVLIIHLIIRSIFGAIGSAIASSKGRSTVGWFFGGFFLGLIGIIIVAVLPNLKKRQEKEKHAESERRRLREQLRQERMKNESLRRHVTARLDTHDRALGLDTRSDNPMLESGQSENIFDQLREETIEEEPKTTGGTRWYYARNGKTNGPYSADEMQRMRNEGTLNAECWVMPVGGRQWRPAAEINSFHAS